MGAVSCLCAANCFGTASVSLPPHVGDHGGRCCMVRTGTNVPVCYICAANAALFNVQHRLLISLHQLTKGFDGWCTLIKKKCGGGANTPPPQKQGEAF